jgi:helix-turn-helix protein
MAGVARPFTLPRGWPRRIRSAAVHATSLAGFALTTALGRMQHIEAQKRPHYPPTGRLAILELRAARNRSLAQAARIFLVTPATIASWTAHLDEEGPQALVRLPEPVLPPSESYRQAPSSLDGPLRQAIETFELKSSSNRGCGCMHTWVNVRTPGPTG